MPQFLAEGHPQTEARREQILDAAMDCAAESGWYDLRLHRVADRLGLPLAAIQAEFRDADAIANAWFARALDAMLAEPELGFDGLAPSERVRRVLLRWFDAQAVHRRVVRSMLGAKLHASHPHHWAPMAFDLSRLMHWALEAARLDARGLPRQAEEVGLTLVFLRALSIWLRDESQDQARTRAFLARNLGWLDRLPRRGG
jgi:AcrR family transcriptional regulator